MNRFKQFTLLWCDAWHKYDCGIMSIFVNGEDKTQIDFFVNEKPITIDITEIEDDLIKQFEEEKIQNLDDWFFYDKWVLDGYNWSLRIDFDDTEICSQGRNAYPKEFVDLMMILHSIGLPFAKCEENVTVTKKYTKEKLDPEWRFSVRS